MPKVDKEQARSLQERKSRFQIFKNWILHHKIETTAILTCIIGVIVILCLVFVREDSGQAAPGNAETPGDSSSPNNPPPPAPDADIVLDSPIFQKLSLVTDLQDSNAPAHKAADWLIAFDFVKLTANAPNLQQRFALATLYFATGGDLTSTQGWTRCSAVPPPAENNPTTEAVSNMQCVVRDGKIICAEQSNFEQCQYTDDPGSTLQAKRFLSPVDECEWFGVTCDANGIVTMIDIENNELVGSLPSELSLLTSLTRLNLANNSIGGTIPKELGLMNDLIEFLLTSNQLEGDVAPELYSLKRLQRFEVERNKLSGSLLPSIANWQDMEIIYLNHNAMTGTLPTELGTLVNLRKATFTENKFSGPIPQELDNLANLELIRFDNNDLTGVMPTGLCNAGIPISADCLFNPDTGITEVTCSCCERCCADDVRCQDY